MIKKIIILLLFFSAHWGFSQVPNELDLFYGDSGVVKIDIDEIDHLSSIDLDQSKLFFAGYTGYYDSVFNYDAVIGCIDSAGKLDTSFNNIGYNRFDFPGNNHTVINDVKVSDSGVFFIGNSLNFGDVDTLNLFIGKLLLNGKLDTSFANNGFFNPSLGGTYDNGYEIELLDNGKILFCGSTTQAQLEHPLMGRLNYDGSLDSTFGSSGMRVWSWDGTLVDGISPVLYEKHGAGGYLTRVTMIDSNYFFTGHYITSTNPMCLMIMLDATGNIVPSYAGLGYRVFEPAPNYANYVMDNYYKNDTIFSLMDIGGTFDGEVVFYLQNKSGVHLSTNSFSLPGVKFYSKAMAVSSTEEVAVTGYYKENGSSALISSEAFATLEMNRLGFQNQQYCQAGVYTNYLNANENSAEDMVIEEGRLFVGGNIEQPTIGNISDIVVLKMKYNPLLKIDEQNAIIAKIYPNPASSELKVDLTASYKFEILDLTGKICKNGMVNSYQNSLDISILKEGMYFIKLSDDKGRVRSFSFVKRQ